MMRFSALFLAAPLVIAAPLPARAQTGLAQVQAHLRAVQTMTAGFTQTDSRGRSLSGTVTIKRPGRIRFAKAASAPGGLILAGWSTVDAQNNRTNVSLSGQRFNVPVADSAFSYRPIQRRGPRR